jgi:hypothetical protein
MTTVRITPGNCNFQTRIHADRKTKAGFNVRIKTRCKQVALLAGLIHELRLSDVLCPLTHSALLKKATESGLHASCPIPLGIAKAIEVEAGLALPTDVVICFEP